MMQAMMVLGPAIAGGALLPLGGTRLVLVLQEQVDY